LEPGLGGFNAVLDPSHPTVPTHVHIWIHCTENRYFRASDDAEQGIGQAGSNLNDAFSAQQQKNEKKWQIMQIAMQKRQKIECSGHTGFYTVLTMA
jgi:hypothetical protein